MFYRTHIIIAVAAIVGFWSLIWAVNSGIGGLSFRSTAGAEQAPVVAPSPRPVSDSPSWRSLTEAMDLQSQSDNEPVEVTKPFYNNSDDVIYTNAGGTVQQVSEEELAAIKATITVSGSLTTGGASGASSSSGSGGSGGAMGSGISSGGGSMSSGGSSSDGDVSADSSSSTNTESTISGGGDGLLVMDNVTVSVVPSGLRLLQDNISVEGKKYAELYCAKNETEAFQILLVNKSDSILQDIEINISEWQGQGSRKPQMTLFREHYVQIRENSPKVYSDLEDLGYYPDALIPFVDPYTGKEITTGLYRANHASISARQNQGYWADVRVDSDVTSGTYTCRIVITSQGSPIAEIPVTLTVWNFTLPAVREWTAWFSMIANLGPTYGLSENKGSTYELLMTRHEDMLYEHGIYPTLHRSPSYDTETGEITFDKYYNRYDLYIKQFVEKYGPGVFRILNYFPNDFDDKGNNPKLAQILYDFHQFQTKHPEYGQFFFIIDEPYSDDAGRKVINVGRIIDEVAPSIKLFINGAWFNRYSDPSTESAVEAAADIRSVYTYFAQKPEQLDRINNMLAQGKTVWATATGWLMDTNILNYRTHAWRSYTLGMTGMLYWRTSVEYPEMDPWVNPVTYIDGSGKKYNGKGMMIYQGTPRKVGFSSPGGPVASMRLKVFRRSVQDYAYFKLLEDLIGRNEAVSFVQAVAPGFYAEYNVFAYRAARKRFGELILQHMQN
jgi:hypothetical protein